jgi:hypothetical protein
MGGMIVGYIVRWHRSSAVVFRNRNSRLRFNQRTIDTDSDAGRKVNKGDFRSRRVGSELWWLSVMHRCS